ncbi:MAG: phosphocholine cytidylyltransferase family protein [Candidatus Heimdallarchaeaceae archaeon]|jgi:choline kinase
MLVLLLAAGRSKRLKPITDLIPKTLIKLNGKAILDLIIETLLKNELRDIYVVTGHGEEYVREHLTAIYEGVNFEFVYNPEYDTRENIYSVLLALNELKESDDLLIINSDVVYHPDILDQFVQNYKGNQLIIDYAKKLGEEEMKVIFDKEGHLSKINKKLEPEASDGEYIGILVIEKESFEKFKKLTQELIDAGVDDYYEEVIQQMVNRGMLISGYSTNMKLWIEVDTHQDLEYAKRIVSNGFQ